MALLRNYSKPKEILHTLKVYVNAVMFSFFFTDLRKPSYRTNGWIQSRLENIKK